MKILSIGYFSADGISNTSYLRNKSLHRIGEVTEVDETFKWTFICKVLNRLFVRYKIPLSYLNRQLNKEIINKVKNEKFDIIWIDKGSFILPSTLRKIKKIQPQTKIVGYSPDNMEERHNQTLWFVKGLKYYDFYITTKSYTVNWFKKMGVKNVMFINKSFEDTFHYPRVISKEDKIRLGGEIGFIGAWEKERCESILYLVDNGLPIRVWGDKKWDKYKNYNDLLKIEGRGLYTEDYAKALSAFDISLCFLRKMNKDLQTARTMEIPACGSLLMAERTNEHESLFEDGKEAVFFSNNQELFEKCRYYLEHPEERKQIIDNGLRRCKNSGYSNYETLKKAIKFIMKAEK